MQLAKNMTVGILLLLLIHCSGKIQAMSGGQSSSLVRGQIYSTLGAPLSGVKVEAQFGKDSSIITTSDTQGYYEFKELPEGQVIFSVGTGWELRRNSQGKVEYGSARRTLELKADQQIVSDFVLYVFPDHFPVLEVVIKGTIRHSDNSPSPQSLLNGVTVRVTDVFTQTVALETKTDSAGHYSLKTPPLASQYIVQASKPGFTTATATIIVRELTNREDRVVDLALSPLYLR
jgi:hypothetical protein